MSPRRGDRPDPEESVEEEVLPAHVRRRLSGREVDLAGRDKLGAARAAAAAGDGAAEAIAAGAVGSDDPAVAGEAAAVMGEASNKRT